MKFIVTLFFSMQLFAQNYTHPYQLSLKKIADDVYVIYRPDHLRASVEGNVTVIINDDHILVVDGSSAPGAAKNAIAYIKQLSPLPVRYLVNTHGHGDHTLGNEEYLKTYPGVQIIAHPKTREYMMATEGGIK
ncbi:MAG: MBL fold metallo-hydrolase [Calditrichaeota bacterium]|nr:MBL fold metallo-hydrolase [Calditrichota bacterium]